MDPYLSDRHLKLKEEVAEFGRSRIDPVAGELDAGSRFPWENVKAMAEMGLLGIPIPEEYGGMGLDYTSYIVVIEELARHDASHAITVSAHTTLGTTPILEFGTEEQRRKWIPALAGGRVLGGFGLTEPSAGSDAAGTRTRATRSEGGWRLRGSKIFITHAGVGEIFTVTARCDGGITNFVVTKPTTDLDVAERIGFGHDPDLDFVPGVRAGKKEDKLGWRASDTRELVFDDARVPDENRLGSVGDGFSNFMKILDSGRIGIAALSLGIAEGAVDAVRRHIRAEPGTGTDDAAASGGADSSSTGGPRSRGSGSGVGRTASQETRFRLAELATEIEAGRHLTYHAARLKEDGRRYRKEAAMAKLFCSELSTRAATTALRILGAEGYTDRHPVERMIRDAKACEIGEGTSEIQKLVIDHEIVRAWERV